MSRHTVAYLAALALMAACDKESTVVQVEHSDVASVTVVNTTPFVVKPFVGEQLASTSNLQAATWMQPCALIPPSSTTLTFKAPAVPADTVVATTSSTNFAAGTRYTTFLTQNGSTVGAFVLPEIFTTVNTDQYGVRIVNATGQTADFYVTATNTSALPATPAASLATNTATGGATGVGGFLTEPVTTPFVRMYAAGNTATQLASVKLGNNALITTNLNWTMGTTVVFTKDAFGNLATFTFGQCQ